MQTDNCMDIALEFPGVLEYHLEYQYTSRDPSNQQSVVKACQQYGMASALLSRTSASFDIFVLAPTSRAAFQAGKPHASCPKARHSFLKIIHSSSQSVAETSGKPRKFNIAIRYASRCDDPSDIALPGANRA